MVKCWIGLASLAIVCLCEGQECSDEVRLFQECIRNNTEPPAKPDFEALKKEIDQCFAQSGCSGPQAPSGPQPPQDQTGGNEEEAMCLRKVHENARGQFVRCMTDKDPDFGKATGQPPLPPPPPPPNGLPGGFPHPAGFNVPPPFPGVPMGPALGPPPPPVPLANVCNNDQTKLNQLKSCLDAVHARHKPSKQEIKARFEPQCKAESTCKAVLGKCETKLKQRQQAVCECQQRTMIQAEQAFQQEKQCANVKKPEKAPGDKPDCGKVQLSPCEKGFDKFYEHQTPANSTSSRL